MTDPTTKAADESTDSTALDPTQAEIDAWAERERARRQAWLNGPSEEERADYATYVRRRRVAEAFDESEARIQEGMRQGLHYSREAQLAAEGAMTVIYRWSRRTLAELVKAGREWEEETMLPRTRRRVPMDDDES